MRYFLLILLISNQLIGQKKIDTGIVKPDNNFNCKDYSFIDPIYALHSFIDSAYKISNICESKNQIEIRFTTSYAPTQMFDIIILSYSNNNWEGRKYEFNVDTLYYDSTLNADAGKIRVSRLKAARGFDSVFYMLKKNNIFSLPNQNEIKNKPHGPTDGLIHSLTFKVNDDYRTYKFSNAKYYIEHSKNKIFRNYYNIIELLSEKLEKE